MFSSCRERFSRRSFVKICQNLVSSKYAHQNMVPWSHVADKFCLFRKTFNFTKIFISTLLTSFLLCLERTVWRNREISTYSMYDYWLFCSISSAFYCILWWRVKTARHLAYIIVSWRFRPLRLYLGVKELDEHSTCQKTLEGFPDTHM